MKSILMRRSKRQLRPKEYRLEMLLKSIVIIFYAIWSASVINDNELSILSSELSDEECRNLLSVLYERRQSLPARSRLQRTQDITGRCVLDLERWLDSEAKEGLALTELDEALRDIAKPALGHQIANEVFAEKTHNLRDLFGRDGLLASKDFFFQKRHH
ncbi:uncharacterized protein LOC119726052 [Patiria miniata]|uniref:Uncharacterized protein n=1 Tax=Patiria miniata TaxID=46514 RepID=A0A913ZR80_PATMI|nr:uncharacterized protein LOC119726052 [Patiria miniata]